MRALALGLLLSLAVGGTSRDAAAQVAVGDSLWRLGRVDEAAAAYRKALEQDRNAVRANFRIAQTLAWSSNIDSALVLLRAARERVPDDPDLLFTEATYLSWARRFPESLLRFDSLIVAHPEPDFDYVRVARARVLSWDGRLREAEEGYREVLARQPEDRDARFGLGQVRAWSADLESAAEQFERLLADDPNEVRVLVALGQVRLWETRLASASRLADRAAAQDSGDADLRSLRQAIARQRGLRVDAGQYWSEDSDRNRNQWQTLAARTVVGDGMRLGASLGLLGATDPLRTARRVLGELSLGLPLGRGAATATLGARVLDPPPLTPGGPAPPSRTVLTGRVGLQQRVGAGLTLGAAFARWPFDEIAALVPLELDIDQWEVTADWRATGKLNFTGMLGGLGYSDGNRRTSWAARGTRRFARGVSLGAFVSGFAFAERNTRYFSPPGFVAAELTAGWSHDGPRWSAAVNGGLGGQRIDTLSIQSQWHLDGRVARQWGSRWALELVAGRSTSAAASAVGAYAYSTLGLNLRRTF